MGLTALTLAPAFATQSGVCALLLECTPYHLLLGTGRSRLLLVFLVGRLRFGFGFCFGFSLIRKAPEFCVDQLVIVYLMAALVFFL